MSMTSYISNGWMKSNKTSSVPERQLRSTCVQKLMSLPLPHTERRELPEAQDLQLMYGNGEET